MPRRRMLHVSLAFVAMMGSRLLILAAGTDSGPFAWDFRQRWTAEEHRQATSRKRLSVSHALCHAPTETAWPCYVHPYLVRNLVPLA